MNNRVATGALILVGVLWFLMLPKPPLPTSAPPAGPVIDDPSFPPRPTATPLTSYASTQVPTEPASLEKFFAEAAAMDQVQTDPAATQARLASLSVVPSELTRIAADSSRSHNERALAVYLLADLPESLLEVLSRDVSASVRSPAEFETSLDLMVLQQLERTPTAAVTQELAKIEARTRRESLRSLTARTLAAAREGHGFWTERLKELAP